jgi:hypothetical protein
MKFARANFVGLDRLSVILPVGSFCRTNPHYIVIAGEATQSITTLARDGLNALI